MDLSEVLKDKINNGTKDATVFVNMIDRANQKNSDESFETVPELLGPFEIKHGKFNMELRQEHSYNYDVSLGQVIENFDSGHLCFLGNAGSGKTTLLKGIARNTIERKYSGFSEVELVVFVKCDQVDTSKSGSLIKVLLSSVNVDLDDQDVQQITTYAEQNPKKLLFLLDGIDQFPSYFYSDIMRNKDGVRKDICSLMQDSMFPGCRIITSARSFVDLGQRKRECNSVAMLLGFSIESLEIIISRNFNHDEANDIIQYFRSNPQVLELCKTPMFLTFTLMAKKKKPLFNPTMKSEVILFLFYNLIHSGHSKFQEKSLENLGKMCYDMIKKEQTHFSKRDLVHYNLSSDEIDEFVLSPLVEGNRKYVFTHQSICDTLACFYMMMKLKMPEFQEDVDKHLHLPQFEIVEYMLSGMSLNSKIGKMWMPLVQAKHLEDKKTCLKNYFLKRLGLLKNNTDNLFTRRLILSLYEAGDSVNDLIKSQIKSIVLGSEKMLFPPLSDFRAIGSIVGICERLENLTINMSLISLNGDVELLCNTIRKTKVKPPKIAKLDLSVNMLDENSLYLIGKLSGRCCVEDLSISSIVLYEFAPSQAMKSLKHGLQKYKLKTLDVSYRIPPLSKKEMLPQYQASTSKLVYKLDRKQSEIADDSFLPEKFEQKLPVPGKWKAASYDFVHSVTTLFGNVKQSVYLYCWNVQDREKTLIQKQLDDTSNLELQIHLFDDVTLTANLKEKLEESICEAFAKMGGKKLHSTKTYQVSPKRSKPTELVVSEDTAEAFYREVIQTTAQQSASLSSDSVGPRLRIKIPSKHMSHEEYVDVLKQISKHESLYELELRCCSTVGSTYSVSIKDLMHRIKELRKKIANLNITATENVDGVASELHGLVFASHIEGLNFEESKGVGNCLNILLKDLKKSNLPTLRKLNISYVKNMKDYAVVGKIMSGRIEELKLMNCDIESHQLENLSENLTNSKVNVLDLSYNANLVHHDVKTLGQILADEVKLLALKGCDLTEDELKGLQDPSFENKQVAKLDLSYNEFEPEDIDAVGEAVKALQVRELAIRSCRVDCDGLETLADSLDNYQQLTHLDLRGNKKIGSNFSPLSRLLGGGSAMHLSIADCKHSSRDLQELAHALKSGNATIHLSSLDISDSDRKINNDFLLAVGELVPLVTDELIVCSPDVENFKENIQKILNDSENKTIKVIYYRSQRTKEVGFFRLSEGEVTECLQKQKDAG